MRELGPAKLHGVSRLAARPFIESWNSSSIRGLGLNSRISNATRIMANVPKTLLKRPFLNRKLGSCIRFWDR